jgi:hypothetical protein
MSIVCHKNFGEIFGDQIPKSFYKPFDPEGDLIPTIVSTIFSAAPVFGELGEVATKATIKEIEIFWSGVGAGGVKLERNTADQLIERQRPALRRPRLGS